MLSNPVERQRKRKERMGKISGGRGKKGKERRNCCLMAKIFRLTIDFCLAFNLCEYDFLFAIVSELLPTHGQHHRTFTLFVFLYMKRGYLCFLTSKYIICDWLSLTLDLF